MGRSWCSAHYDKWRKYGNPTEDRRRTRETCTVDECDKAQHSHGYCRNHARRWKRWGDPNVRRPLKTLEQRFWPKVQVTSAGCWEWQGSKDKLGYPRFADDSNTVRMAYRVWWEHNYGPVPEGLELDHICHNHSCVNLDHLRLATSRQNTEYRSGPTAKSTTGERGVYLNKRHGNYVAKVHSRGKVHHVGTYETVDDAAKAVRAARARLFDFPEFEPAAWS